MAQMYPDGEPTKATASDAERKIYYLLKAKLDKSFHVFHSVRWFRKEPGGKLTPGEADFIIVHQELGILIIEVKGGGISVEGRQWKSIDRNGDPHDIDDPFIQAENSAYSLKECFKAAVPTKPYAKQYWTEHAVWFPDLKWHAGSVPLPHVRDELVLDAAAMIEPEPAIRVIMARNKRKRRYSDAALEALIDVLAPKRTLKARLREQFTAEQDTFIRLRDDQYRKLSMMSHFPRLTVRGAAGTGKTVLALEKARQLARQELDVLLVCSNRSLARWLKAMIDQEPAEMQRRIEVHNLQQLTTELTGEAYQLLEDATEQDLHQQEELGSRKMQLRLATEFTQAVRVLEAGGKLHTYDAILVDEGQDFERPLWGPLYKLLRDPREGVFIAFYDPAQREGDGDGTPSIPGGNVHELFLSENCRNSQAVFDTSKRFYTGKELPACIGPSGKATRWLDPDTVMPSIPGEPDAGHSDTHNAAALESVLDELTSEGIAPCDILVVVGRPIVRSKLYRRHTLGKHRLSNYLDIQNPDVVRVTTVRAVKGLEAQVVVMVELDGIEQVREASPAMYARYMYIATSRAISFLIVLSTPEKSLLRVAPA